MSRNDSNEPDRNSGTEETKDIEIAGPPNMKSLLKSFDTIHNWFSLKLHDDGPMIVIDNPLLIPTPLVLCHKDEPRWSVIQHIKKTHPFLTEEFTPEHSSFKSIQSDITMILKCLELPTTKFHSTLAAWLI
jgi:hypothetical protein